MEKEEMILTITNEMSNNLTNYQLELLKNVLIIQFKNIEITILTDEIKKKVLSLYKSELANSNVGLYLFKSS